MNKTIVCRIVLTLIVLVGLCLRLYHIGDHGLFVDEVYSVLVADGSADPELLQFDASRPFYFWLLKLWIIPGTSEEWMRFLSTIFGLANIVLIYHMGKTFCNRKTGLIAATLTALSPMEIHYSQQVRMYTLGSCLAMCGTLMLVWANESKKKIFLFGWALSRVMMVLTLPLTALLLAVDGLYALAHNKANKLLPLTAVLGAGIVLLWSPFLLIILKAQTSDYDSWRSTLDVPNIVDFLTLLVNYTASATPLQESGGLPIYDIFTGAYTLLVPILIVLALVACRRNKKLLWCALWALMPLTILFVWSNFKPPLFITRYTMFAAPFVVALMAAGWDQLLKISRPLFVIAGLIYLIAAGSYLNRFYSHPVHEDWRPVSQYLAEHEKAGDEIVVWNYHSQYLINYYYQGKNHISDMKVVLDKKSQNDEALNIMLDFDPRPGQRLWLVSRQAAPGWHRMHAVYDLYRQALEKKYKVLSHQDLTMCDVYEVQVP